MLYLQLKVVLWKNLIIRGRHWFLTICETLIPVLLFLCIAYGRSKITGLSKTEITDVTYNDKLPVEYTSSGINLEETLFYYSPSNDYFSDIIKKVQIKFQLTNNNIKGFNEKEQLLEEYARKKNNSVVAIIFNSDKQSTNFEYTIRTHEDFFSWNTDKLYESQYSFVPSTGSIYLWKGFLAIQKALDIAFIETNNGSVENIDLETLEFPYPPYKADSGIFSIFIHYLPLITLFSFIFVCPAVLKRVVEEKYSGIKELMKMVGMRSWMLWLGWFIYSIIPMILSVFLIIIIMKVDFFGASYPLIEFTDASVLVVFLILYCMACTVACFLVSTFFRKPTLATLVGILLWILTYFVPKYMLDFSTNNAFFLNILFMLFPNMALHYGYSAISFYEEREIGLRWSNLCVPGGGGSNEVTMLLVWGMLIFDICLYMLLTMYFDRILPGKYGIPESIFFPFKNLKKCLCRKNEVDGCSDSETSQLKHSEAGKAIELKNVTKKYGKKIVVDRLSFDIYQNQITVLLGHNGAGKSTTMGMITGMIEKTGGSIRINGTNINSRYDASDTIGLCPQYNLFFPDLTVWEHLKFFAMLKGKTGQEIEREIKMLLKLLDLEDKANAKADTLSGGMKRKLSLGMAVVGGSQILILDEPSSGMDPESRRHLWNLLLRWRREKAILVTTHFMEEADVLGDRIAIMKEGGLQCYDTPLNLKKKYETGHNLVLLLRKDETLKKDENVHKIADNIEKEIRIFIPDVKLKGVDGYEVVFLLPFESNYVKLFEHLENKRDELKIENISFTCTTLEDVFLNTKGDKNQTYDENDSTDISSISSASTDQGILLTSQALLYKRYKFILRKLRTYLIPCLISVFFLLLCIYLGQEANGYSSSGGPPFKMALSSYGKTSVMLNISDDPDTLKMKNIYQNLISKEKSSFRLVNDVSDEIIKEGIINLPYYRQHMVVSAEFSRKSHSIEAVAMYNNLAKHSAPISLNLITNTLAKAVLGEEYSISITNHPLDNINPSTSADQISETQIALLWLMILPLGFLFFLGSFIYFPFVELSTNFTQIQFMTGVPPWFYWLTTYTTDFVFYFLFALIMSAISLFWTPFGGINEFGALLLILVLYGACGIPFAYLFSRKKSFSGAYALFIIVGIMTGVIFTTIVSVMEESGSEYYIDISNSLRKVFLMFCPPFGFTYLGVKFSRKVVSNYNFAHMSRLQLLSQCSVDEPNACCAGPGPACDAYKSYLSVLKDNIFWMVFGAVLFLAINILLHNYFMRKICNTVRRKLYKLLFIKRSYKSFNITDVECGDIINNAKVNKDVGKKSPLSVSKLKKSYSGREVVNNVDFNLKKGECMGILGVNGAGKTTTFRMLTREEIKDNGTIKLNDVDIDEDKYLKNLGYCPQNDALNLTLTGRDILKTMAWMRGIQNPNVIIPGILEAFELTEYADIPCEYYSGGNKRKLSFALAILGCPEVILLDEPTNGVDPSSRRKFWTLIKNIKNQFNSSFVLTSHSMTECEALCNDLKIMKEGRIQKDGTISQLKKLGFTAKLKLKPTLESVSEDEVDGEYHNDGESSVKTQQGNDTEMRIAQLKEYVCRIFPEAEIRDEHFGLLHYYVKDKDHDRRWSELFRKFEDLKLQFSDLIEDYLLSEASLEEVFLDVAREEKI